MAQKPILSTSFPLFLVKMFAHHEQGNVRMPGGEILKSLQQAFKPFVRPDKTKEKKDFFTKAEAAPYGFPRFGRHHKLIINRVKGNNHVLTFQAYALSLFSFQTAVHNQPVGHSKDRPAHKNSAG